MLVLCFSGYLAEHMDLRIFLTGGMLISGIFTILFGMGYFWKVHSLAFFLTMQVNNTVYLLSVQAFNFMQLTWASFICFGTLTKQLRETGPVVHMQPNFPFPRPPLNKEEM